MRHGHESAKSDLDYAPCVYARVSASKLRRALLLEGATLTHHAFRGSRACQDHERVFIYDVITPRKSLFTDKNSHEDFEEDQKASAECSKGMIGIYNLITGFCCL